jgi:glycosyltransferase involved in cell wall biosynthesis
MQVKPGLELQFLHGVLYKSNISLRRFLNHWQLGRRFRRLACAAKRPDVILVSFPTIELSDEAVQYGLQHQVPVFVDIRDLWPDEMMSRLPKALRWLGTMVLARLYYQTRRALRRATGIVAISESYLTWAHGHARRTAIASDQCAPIGYSRPNVVDDVQAGIAGRKLLRMGVREGAKIAWFCGTFVGSIDLATVIAAARILQDDERILFVLSGSGEREAQWRADSCGLRNVVFTGWIGPNEQEWLAKRAWIGLAAYKKGALMSLPNKLFEYMSAGLPIVSSLHGEAQQLLSAEDIGVTYEPGNPRHLADCLLELAANAARVEILAANAARAYAQHFNAASVYAKLARHLESSAAK